MPVKKKLYICFFALFGFGWFAPLAHSVATTDHVETQKNNLVVPVQTSFVGNYVTIGGTVAPKYSSTLSAQMPGRVLQIAGKEGDRFKYQNVLVVLNTEALLAKRRAAESQLASANAAWYNASVQHQRQLSSPSTSQNAPGGMGMPNMFDQVMTNPMADMMGTRDTDTERYADIEQRRSQMEQARQHTMQIYAEIQQIDANLRDTRTLAPFDGVIVKKLVEVGDTVQPGQPMLEFADTKALQVVADIPARLVHNLKEGDNVLAKLDVSEGEVNVKVATIFPVADTNRHTVRVEFDLPPSTKASAGTYAEIRLNDTHAAINNYPVIPASSIVWRGGLPMVYVIDNNQQTSLRMIRIGETLPTGEITILSGLREKELIVDKPAPGLTSGQTVNPPAQ